MLQVGDQLPDFQSLNQDDETVNSKDFIGKKLVVFFYPKANTPGCTAEACDINDNLETLKKELTLDGFQEAIVKNLLKDNQSKSKEIIESTEYEDLKKKDMLETLAENFNIEMRKILSKDQSAKYEKFKNKYYKGQNPVAVYNRNKNNYKSTQVKKYNTIKTRKAVTNNGVNTKSMKEYERRKKLNDGSHLHVRGNSQGKGKSGK